MARGANTALRASGLRINGPFERADGPQEADVPRRYPEARRREECLNACTDLISSRNRCVGDRPVAQTALASGQVMWKSKLLLVTKKHFQEPGPDPSTIIFQNRVDKKVYFACG